MRIAFLFSALNHSGAPKMLAWVANQMAKRGHEVHIVSFFETGNMPFLGENVTHHCLNINRNGSRLTRNTVVMAKTQYQLLRKLRQLKPDGIVSFNISGTYIPVGGIKPVNIGAAVFPLLVSGIFFWLYKKK